MSQLLEAHELHTAYGLSRVLFGVSIEVAAGVCRAAKPHWFITAFSGLGGKAGSVLTPRSRSSA